MIRPRAEPLSRIEWWGLAAALALAAVLMWPVRGYLTDDTFIHLQYARRLAAGQGLVFNPGERVYGCTSPLWVGLLAGGIGLGLDGLATARMLGFVATLASVALFFQLARRTLEFPALRAWSTVAWAGHAWMARWSVSGMETPLAVGLTLAGFVTLTDRRGWGSRPLVTGALWSLAALARPEAVLLILLWCAALVLDRPWNPGRMLRGALPVAAIYGSWLVFAWVYFGAAWPETLSAKTAGGGGAAALLVNLWREARIVGATDGVLALVLGLGLLRAAGRGWPRGPQAWLPWAWVVGLPALYALRGVQVLSRYLLPVLPVLAVLAWHTVEGWMRADASGRPRSRAAVLGLALAAAVWGQNLAVFSLAVRPQVDSFTAGLSRSLVPWGKWFARHAPEDASIGTPDIGAIGYYSRRRVVDLGGLVTPQMIPLLEREPPETMVAELRFAAFARPLYLVDRAPSANDLKRRSRYGACLIPLGTASVPNLGIARPGRVIYTFYRVDWTTYDQEVSR